MTPQLPPCSGGSASETTSAASTSTSAAVIMGGTIGRVGAGRRGINRLTTAFTTRGPIYLTIRLRRVGTDRLFPVGNDERLR